MDNQDFIQLELTFEVFARSMIDIMLEKKIASADDIAKRLLERAEHLDANENYGAARKLEAMVEFAKIRSDARKIIDNL